jgi:hypothetical protein
VPTWIKYGIPVLIALYFLFPIDVIPDFIPGLGQLDDLGVILLGMSMMIRFAPQQVVSEHRQALGLDFNRGQDQSRGGPNPSWPPAKDGQSASTKGSEIDGEYRVIPPDRR